MIKQMRLMTERAYAWSLQARQAMSLIGNALIGNALAYTYAFEWPSYAPLELMHVSHPI